MARKQDLEEGGHPLFWLLLGFLCGVMATLGALLMLSGEVSGDGQPAAEPPTVTVPIETPKLDGAPPPGGPVVLIPQPSVEPLAPIQEPIVRPALPTFRPEPQAPPAKAPPAKPAPRALPPATTKPTATPRPAPGRSNADQMAEDAAASGLTARTR